MTSPEGGDSHVVNEEKTLELLQNPQVRCVQATHIHCTCTVYSYIVHTCIHVLVCYGTNYRMEAF